MVAGFVAPEVNNNSDKLCNSNTTTGSMKRRTRLRMLLSGNSGWTDHFAALTIPGRRLRKSTLQQSSGRVSGPSSAHQAIGLKRLSKLYGHHNLNLYDDRSTIQLQLFRVKVFEMSSRR